MIYLKIYQHSIIKCLKKIYKFFKKRKNDSIFKEYQCVMLDSPWGTGKTYYYNNKIKKKLNSPIYISCFSYTKLELLTEIAIKNSFIIRAISFNGLFVNFMKSNWNLLIPKNRIIVLDDLERLHQNDENILDIIGLIDRLLKNNNKILLIGHLDKILENSKIASEYLEKIIDHFSPFNKNSFLESVLEKFFEKNKCNDENKQDIKNIIEKNFKHKSSLNLRIIKKSLPILLDFYKEIDEKYQNYEKVVKEYISEKISFFIEQRYKYFIDINKFNNDLDQTQKQEFKDITKEDIKYFNTSKIKKIDKQSLINYLLYDFSKKVYEKNIVEISLNYEEEMIWLTVGNSIINYKDREPTDDEKKIILKLNEQILNFLENIWNDSNLNYSKYGNNEKIERKTKKLLEDIYAFIKKFLIPLGSEIDLKDFVEAYIRIYNKKNIGKNLIHFLQLFSKDFYPIVSIIYDKEKYDEFEKIFNEISNSNDEP